MSSDNFADFGQYRPPGEPHPIPFAELFAAPFFLEYTRFEDLHHFLAVGGFHVTTADDLRAIPLEALDKHVGNNTPWPSWAAMQRGAFYAYARRRTGDRREP